MKKTYRSALGKHIDIDTLRLTQENTIAVGNMKVNARGDELGPGGEVVRTRNRVMDDYYKLQEGEVYNQPVAAAPATKAEPKTNSRLRGSAAKRILDDQDGEQ